MNAKNLKGPGDFSDADYDRWEAKAAARDALIEDQMDFLASESFDKMEDTVIYAIENIADNVKGEQDRLNQLLFDIWQNYRRGLKPNPFIVQEIAKIMNKAFEEVITKEVKECFS